MILIFDMNNLAYRARYSYNLSYLGKDVSVLYGVVKILQSVINKTEANYVIACWDYGIPEFRKRAVEEYKESRNHEHDDTWQDFLYQMNVLHEILPYFGVLSLRRPQCEADDLAYHASNMFNGNKMVVSSDGDMLQCIDGQTSVHNPMKDIEISIENFKDYTGYDREHYLFYRAMIGDSSDELPGIKGIGKKTAQKLIYDYGLRNVEALYDAASNGNLPKGISNKILSHDIELFKSVQEAMNLQHDRVGARLCILRTLDTWIPYSFGKIRRQFLVKYGFNSFARNDFLTVFDKLENPRNTLISNWSSLKYPKIWYRKYPAFPGSAEQSTIRHETKSKRVDDVPQFENGKGLVSEAVNLMRGNPDDDEIF